MFSLASYFSVSVQWEFSPDRADTTHMPPILQTNPAEWFCNLMLLVHTGAMKYFYRLEFPKYLLYL
jgi:hypothetical protein